MLILYIDLISGSPIHQAATWNLAKENRHAVAFKACIDILETHLKKPLFIHLTCFLSTSNGFLSQLVPISGPAQHPRNAAYPQGRVESCEMSDSDRPYGKRR